MSFANLKKSRKNRSVDALVEKAKEISGQAKKDYKDDRFWKPTVDDNGNGFAVIRFLPSKNSEEGGLPWARYWDHFFKGKTGQYYIEKSLTSIGQTDPVGEENRRLWNMAESSNNEGLKKAVSNRKRKLHYITNIYVVSDPSNKENEGKVFLYDFGKKIMDMIMEAMQPKFEGETPIVPYDFWDGADFEIKMYNNDGGFRDYSRSRFKAPAPLLGGDDKLLEEVYNKVHDLSEFTDPANYKSYDELKARLQVVLGEAVGEGKQQKQDDLEKTESPNVGKSSLPAEESFDDDDGEESFSYFAKLAAEED